jgi:hypothetical protein
LFERRRGRRREVGEGACIGAATMLQPWTLRLILNLSMVKEPSEGFFEAVAKQRISFVERPY